MVTKTKKITNQKYPGLTSDEINRLEQYTKGLGLTGFQLEQKRGELYEQVITQKTNKQRNDDRQKAKNQITYKSVTTDDKKESTYLKNNRRLEDLVDIVKNKYNLDPKANSQDIINGVLAQTKDKLGNTNSLNAYLNKGDKSYLYEMGYEENPAESEQKNTIWDSVKQGVKNIGGGLVDSFSTDFMKAGANATAWVMKKAGMDEEEVENRRQTAINKIENMMDVGQDKDTLTYKATNVAGDLAQLATGEGEIKLAAKAATKGVPVIEKLAKLGKATDDLVREFPVLGKLASFTAKKGTRGAADTVLFNAINGEGTSGEEMVEGGLINTALGVAGKVLPTKQGIQNFAKKLEVGGLMNAKTLEAVNNEIKNTEGKLLIDIKDAGKWLLERCLKGEKKEMSTALNDYAETLKEGKKELFKLSNERIASPEAKEAIQGLIKKYDGTVGNKQIVSDLRKIENMDDFSAEELDNIKGLIDDSGLHIYNNAAEQADNVIAGGWARLRRAIKEQIEGIVDREGLGDIRKINSEIQVAKTLEKGINGKLTQEEVGSIIPKGWVGVVDRGANLLGFEGFSKSLANALAKFSGMERKTIAKTLEEVGNFDDAFLSKVIPENKMAAFKKAVNDIVGGKKSTAIKPQSTELGVKKPNKKFKTEKTTTEEGTKKSNWNLKDTLRQALLFGLEDEIKDE